MPDAADFNLNLLKTFLSLYRERNMTRAARELVQRSSNNAIY